MSDTAPHAPAEAARRPLEEYERVLAEAEQLLDDVDSALRRIREGTYRSCEICGDPIGDDRLDGRPTTRRCAEHGEDQALGDGIVN